MQVLRLAVLAVSIGVALMSGGTAKANLLTNGSFENTASTFVNDGQGLMLVSGPAGSSIPGWTVVANNVHWEVSPNPFGLTPSDGSYYVDLTGVTDNTNFATIQQIFATVSGVQYYVSFDMGANNGSCRGLDCTGPMGINVIVSGVTQDFTAYDPVGPGMHWQTFGMDFTANSASTTLQLHGLSAGHYFLGLDNVVVTQPAVVPAPDTFTLMLVGLSLLGFIARHRKQQVTA